MSSPDFLGAMLPCESMVVVFPPGEWRVVHANDTARGLLADCAL